MDEVKDNIDFEKLDKIFEEQMLKFTTPDEKSAFLMGMYRTLMMMFDFGTIVIHDWWLFWEKEIHKERMSLHEIEMKNLYDITGDKK